MWFLGAARGIRKEEAVLRCQIQWLRDRWVSSQLHPVPHGCCWGQVPRAALHPPQGSDFPHPAPSRLRNMEFPAGQSQVTHPGAGGSDPQTSSLGRENEPSPFSVGFRTLGEYSGLSNAGKGQGGIPQAPGMGKVPLIPASAPSTLHQVQGVKPTPKILPPIPPSCHMSHLLPHTKGAPEAGWGGNPFGSCFGDPFMSSAHRGLEPWH